MADPSMSTILDNVDKELSNDPNVSKFAPMKHRLNIPGNSELEHIQGNLRRLFNEVQEEVRKLQSYVDSLKLSIETLQRGVG